MKEEDIIKEIDNELSEIVDGYNVNYGVQGIDLENQTVTVVFNLTVLSAEDNFGKEYIGLTSW